MVNRLRIAIKNVNLEIIAKILNSVARKYGCWVRYLPRENRLKFIGDHACFQPIVEEMLAFFSADPALAPVLAGEHPHRCQGRPRDQRSGVPSSPKIHLIREN